MPRICHISDWHGQFKQLPEADVYVITGDMLENYPETKQSYYGRVRYINKDKEVKRQLDWFYRKFGEKRGKPLGLRHFFPKSCKHNPVVVVRGNHDFVDLGPMFGGKTFECTLDASRSVEFCGLKFGGFRGVPYINGEWSDELQQQDFYNITAKLPDDLDVLLTHSPPNGILDKWMGENLGTHALTDWIVKKQYLEEPLPKLFCFGHIHNQKNVITENYNSDCDTHLEYSIIFSNAATCTQIIDL